MKFYIDFEVTQPEQEIIEIGVVCENGNTFCRYVKPNRSEVSPFITQLTGITNQQLENEENVDTVLNDLYYWLEGQGGELQNCEFYCYGSSDRDFLNKNLTYLTHEVSYIMCCVLIVRMVDFATAAKEYFRGSIALIDAFNYICKASIEQQHNALQDAIMLRALANEISDKEALAVFPFDKERQKEEAEANFVWPKGTFACYSQKKKKIKDFANCQEAVDWIIKVSAPTSKVYKNRVATRIMKAVRKKTLYAGHYWTRNKKE